LFSDDADVFRVGGLYLRIVGPAYLCFGLGLGLFYVAQGFGRGTAAAIANATRLVVSASGGLVAIYWLNLGLAGFFAAVAIGFVLYAALLVWAVLRVKEPAAGPKAARGFTIPSSIITSATSNSSGEDNDYRNLRPGDAPTRDGPGGARRGDRRGGADLW